MTDNLKDYTSQSAERSKLIITGCPRSGTTAIMDLLNTHPDIKITPELSSFDPFLSEERVLGKTEDEEIITTIKEFGVKNLYDNLPYKICGDKLPGYALPAYREHLLSLDLRYVFCLRNCRGFVDSSIRYYNEGHRYYWTFDNPHDASCMWYNYNKSMLELMLELKPNNFVLMKYEEAVLDIQHYLREISRICNFPIELKNPFKHYYPVRVRAGKDLDINEFNPHARFLMEIFGYE